MKLSVVIPCRNAAETLGEQLAALAGQAWAGEWEAIVADNGSTDGSLEVASAWSDRLPGFRVVDASDRRGASHARNRGAEAATGDALLFCDADDVVAPGWLAAMADALEHHEFCASRFEYARLNPGRRPRGSAGSQERGLQQLWYSPHVAHAGGSGLAILRSLHGRIGGFDESLVRLEDTDYCIRATLQGVHLSFVEDAVVHVRLRATSPAVFRQARAWARTNCLLYARYRAEAEDWTVAWFGYLYGWWVLSGAVARKRRRLDGDSLARRVGWKVGLLEGSLRYRVAPPDFRHGVGSRPPWISAPGSPENGSRKATAKVAALAGTPRRAAKGMRRRARRAVKWARRWRMGTLTSVSTHRPVASLTFDDGPDPRFTPALLDLLDAHDAKATFFVVGERAARYPELVRQIRDRGHAIGNHSWSHRSVHEMSPDDLAEEIRRTETVVGGNGGRWFRPPYGQLSPEAWKVARSLGYEVVGWSLMSGDWRPVEPETLAATLLGEIRPGAIVLLHDSLVRPTVEEGRDREFMLAGLDRALSSLRGRIAFVRLDELLAAGRAERRAWFPSGGSTRTEAAEEADGREPTGKKPEPHAPRAVAGTLRVSTFGAGPASAGADPGVEHRSAYVRDRHYGGMEDNDLRGFLDGGFQWAWNQPSQVHVRIGRPGWAETGGPTPRYGEHELFRVLQRWDGIGLPAETRVNRAKLVLHVEKGCERTLEVHLYEVRRDWDPGAGGVLRNNLSPPAPGEVWWNEAAAGAAAWAKPGAGHASDVDPGADTGAMPLATTRYQPGDTRLTFDTAALARYVESRTSDGRPLLFLVKLADVDEDLPGSHLAVFSANHGDGWNTSRRPKLLLRWRSPSERRVVDRDVRLEYGRALELGDAAAGEEGLVLFEWLPATESRLPSVWSGMPHAGPPDGGRRSPGGPSEVPLARPVAALAADFHLLAAENVVPLGGTFRAGIRDTWVTSGPPERQVVEWSFTAPSGRRTTTRADYAGDYRWEVEHRPDEIGRWRYSWTHRFGWEPTRGTGGSFDVVATSPAECIRLLGALAAEIGGAGNGGPGDRAGWMTRLMRLERAAVALLAPDAWRGADGEAVREAVKDVRAAIWGRPVPEEFPLEAHDLVTERDGRPLRDPYPRRPAPRRPDEPGRLFQKLRSRLGRGRGSRPRERSTSDTESEG